MKPFIELEQRVSKRSVMVSHRRWVFPVLRFLLVALIVTGSLVHANTLSSDASSSVLGGVTSPNVPLAKPSVDPSVDPFSLSDHLWFLQDDAKGLSFNDILELESRGEFQKNDGRVFSRGVTDSAYWFKVVIDRRIAEEMEGHRQGGSMLSAARGSFLLEIDHPWISDLTYFGPRANDGFETLLTGYKKPFKSRGFNAKGFVFPVVFSETGDTTVYFRAVMSGQTLFPIKLYSDAQYRTKSMLYSMAIAAFYGVLIAMLAYNFFIYYSLKVSSYLLYVVFIFSFALMSFVVDGYGYMFLWPDNPSFNISASYLLPLLVAVMMLAVTRDFLDIKEGWIDRLYDLASVVIITSAVLISFASMIVDVMALSATVTALISSAALVLIIYSSVVRIVDGYEPAKPFMAAWMCLIVGGAVKILTIFDLMPYNVLTEHAVHVGATLQVLLLAFALAHRINNLDQQRIELQKNVLEETDRNNRLKSEFLAVISHELRTPMNGVEGALELMKTKNLDDEMRNYVETASHSSADMVALVDSILSFSEAQSGSLVLQEEAFSVREVLKPIRSRFTRRCSQKGLLFNCQVSDNVPKYLVGDIKKISEVMDKLIDNAVKFTESGGVSMSVWRQGGVDQNGCVTVAIQVADTGHGVVEEEKGRIFDSFRQADSSYRRKYGGLGIGLAMSKQLMRLMGGDISYTSRPGVGSQFQFSVGLKVASPSQVTKLQLQESQMELRLTPSKRHIPLATKVLVVEDNSVNQQVLTGILKKLGCEVMTADNGLEALDLLSCQQVDMILMDCQMPVMDGFEATRLIRGAQSPNCHVPIIAVTANTMREDEESCREAGMNDYMKKPVKKDIIEEKLSHWLDARSIAEL